MAIKISGTTVVNDSRQLQNIASLDSTTAATIGAAAGGTAFFEDDASPGLIYSKSYTSTSAGSTVITGPQTFVYAGSGSFTGTSYNVSAGDYVSFSGSHLSNYRGSEATQYFTFFINGIQVVQYNGYISGSYASLSSNTPANAGGRSGGAAVTSAMVNARSGSYDVWTYTKSGANGINRSTTVTLKVYNDSDI
jgi:hypothetical protein